FVAGFIGSPAMNFIPVKVDQASGGLNLHINGSIVLPVPAARTERYKALAGRDGLVLGLRPEHITETSPTMEPGVAPFDITLDVIEPMGNETLVYFTIAGEALCGRVNPNAGAADGQPMRLAANLNHMHLMDADGKVL
ncbi:MAG: TOBE domain-containing protein, partial [Phreatobacter sp.]|nr:TOBE domain-containing protein [Phreatobacter sp.]